MIDPIFTNGVIAVKERQLLGDKILRFVETSAEDVLRALHESGFGSGAEEISGEAMCEAEERALDSFIREYAPSKTELKYLLSPRDFHNAKAICKAKILNTTTDKLLAPEGLISVADISSAIDREDYDSLKGELGAAVKEVMEAEEITGAEIGAIFDKALFCYLAKATKWNPLLKKLLSGKADRTNILTAMRSAECEHAQMLYVGGGKVKTSKLDRLFEGDIEKAFEKTDYADFFKLCYAAKEKGLPFTEAERALESFEAEYFVAKKYELEGKQPFLYYVFRRRAEILNVRIITVCLNAGLSANDIKRRLRAI